LEVILLRYRELFNRGVYKVERIFYLLGLIPNRRDTKIYDRAFKKGF